MMNEAYIKIGISAALPVLVAAVLRLFDQKTAFAAVSSKAKQVVFGLVFGGLAIVGTEWGIPLNGAMLNCRDAAVLIGGLMFGAPAGIIAGIIGGVERWIAVAWGVGAFTRVACSVSTVIAGIYAAALRKFMFEDKKPGWLISFAIGVVMEIFHTTMVFITNMATPTEAMAVVKACTIPMVAANGISVMLAAAVLAVISKEKLGFKRDRIRISQTIQRWLLVTVMLAFTATSFFVYRFQDQIAQIQTDALLELALEDASEYLHDTSVFSVAKTHHVGKTGYILIADRQGNLVSEPESLADKDLTADCTKIAMGQQNTTISTTVGGETVYARFCTVDNYHIISVLPAEEALQMRNIVVYVNTFMEVLAFAILFALIYLLIKRVVVNQIKTVNVSLAKIAGGDLDEVVNVRSNEEFAALSDDINATVNTLKRYIDEASARIDKELELARSIQSSALPGVFPAFPKRSDFDIFASMNPAREVGGDFYDFYMTDHDTLHFLVADVSGKGIPAAMFMMRAKTELKSLTEAELPLCEVFTRGNAALCEGNDAEMFVTAWQGSIDLQTGLVRFVNAGHNPPLVRHGDGTFEYLNSYAGFVLAGLDGVAYRMQELQLVPGDIIFLYTDGVTEATNTENQLYGEKRLRETINSGKFESMQELCRFIKGDVDAFAAGAPRFDDITMLALKYIGTLPAPSIHFDEAKIDDIPMVTEFAESELNKLGCPMSIIVQINIAIDEIYSNIVQHGYPKGKGPVTVEVLENDEMHSVSVRFTDEGIPYNPLTREDPDITVSAEEREIGGLGIYLVKKTMDDVKYTYENKQNILTIQKNLI